jgi:mycoredoxin
MTNGVMVEPAVVYYKPGCPFGIRLRAALSVRRIPHTSIRFRDDESGAARVRAANGGLEISPTVHVNGQWLTNPHWRVVRRAATAHESAPDGLDTTVTELRHACR